MLEEPVHPLCVVHAHLLGVIKAEQTENAKRQRNDRLVGSAVFKDKAAEEEQLKKLDPRTLRQIERFFVSYNSLLGKQFKVLGYEGLQTAMDLVKNAQKRFSRSK